MTYAETEVNEMDKAVRCLFIELPELVAIDVQKRWLAVKEKIEWLDKVAVQHFNTIKTA